MPPVELDTLSHVVTEFAHNVKDGFLEPILTRSKANESDAPLLNPIIDDVDVPSAPVVTSEDLSVPAIAEPPSEVEMMVSGFIDEVASYTLVRVALKTVDYTLDISEKYVTSIAPPATKYVQKLRRYLRVVRHAGRSHARAAGGNVDNKKTRSLRDLPARRKKAMREASITGYFADLFKVNFLLSFLGLELIRDEEAPKKHKSAGHITDDDESTVYKLMKEYDSQDDEDYVPSDSSEDSMEYESDSENETTEDKLNKHYPEQSDEDYVPSKEESKESIEYNSDADESQDAEESQEEAEESQDVEESQDAEESQEEAENKDCEEVYEENRRASTSSVESTTVDKLMKDSDDDVSQEDPDYVPEEEKTEDSCEYNSDEEAIKDDAQDEELVEVAEEASQDSDAVAEEASQDSDAVAEETSQDSDAHGPEEVSKDSEAHVAEEVSKDSDAHVASEASKDSDAHVAEKDSQDSQEDPVSQEDSQEVEELREDSHEVEELLEDSLEMGLREDSREMEELREDSQEMEELREDSPEMELREDSQEMDEVREDSEHDESEIVVANEAIKENYSI